MDVLLFFVHGSVPTNMVWIDLVTLSDVGDGGVDECLPIFKIGIAKSLGVLTGE